MLQFTIRRLLGVAAAAVLILATSADAATFSVLTSKLTEPEGRMAINIDPGVGTFFQDTEVTLLNGTYTVSLRGGQADYGTFTINSDTIVSTTGALVLTEDGDLDFDLTKLARVELAGSTLTIPLGRGTTGVFEATTTFFDDSVMYFPPTNSGFELLVTDRSGRARYGAFIVSPTLQVNLPMDNAGALTLSGNTIGFNHSLLAEINIHGDGLTVPAGLQTLAIPETAGTFFGSGTVFLPPSLAGQPPYTITDRGLYGIFGAFDIASDLSVSDAGGVAGSANALVINVATPTSGGTAFDIFFDTDQLATFTLENSALSSPTTEQVLVVITESVSATGQDLTVNLPPTLDMSRPYQVTPRSGVGDSYGNILIETNLNVVYSGALLLTEDRFAYDTCALHQLKLTPATGISVGINELTAGVLASEYTVVIPSGDYEAKIVEGGDTRVISFSLGAPEDTSLPDTEDANFELVGCVPPTADAGGPYLVAVNSTIQLDGTGSPDPVDNYLTYFWWAEAGVFNDENVQDPFYTAGDTAGIFNLNLTVTDPSGLFNTATTFVVVYDPSAGFVTGGGWIDSPAGACPVFCGNAAGKANFGFLSKYKKGASIPTGNTEFNFSAGALNFHSESYEWLVVNQNGTNAQFKGAGTINGEGGYQFMLWAGDDNPDTFRIKIWYENGGEVVYDNGFDGSGYETGQPIDRGNIVVHNK